MDKKIASPVHTIRLRHPWQCQPEGDINVWSRKFNWPAELAPDETVQLVVEPLETVASISLNDLPLKISPNGRTDISTLISHHNQLVISVSATSQESPQQCPFDVQLEICSSADC